jgi:predicted fused transcriptional regulator/phosphomethylpyrimidine kinase
MVEEITLIKNDELIIIKIALAKLLYKNGYDQKKISEFLKITQPMVSNYIYSEKNISRQLKNLSEHIFSKFIKNEFLNFQTIIRYEKKNKVGKIFLASSNELINDEKNKVIQSLINSYNKIKDIKLSKFIPAVKVNIAMSIKKPKSKDDVASFLNGLIIADDKVVGHNGIRFGTSKHLSDILLKIIDQSNFRSIMNIADISNFKIKNLKQFNLTRNFSVDGKIGSSDLLIHKGDFGIEPCAYILGVDAEEVADKLINILEEFSHE